MRIDSLMLEEFIRLRLPKVHNHLVKIEVPYNTFLPAWLMKLFVGLKLLSQLFMDNFRVGERGTHGNHAKVVGLLILHRYESLKLT